MGNKISKVPKSKDRNGPKGSNFSVKNRDGLRIIDRRAYPNLENHNYPFPDDFEEQDRNICQHYRFRYIWESNFSAPVEETLVKGANVLDICCGVGIWTLEMAHQYPQSTFVGIDTLSNFPKHVKPTNVTFLQANVLDTLPVLDESFDFVFMRGVKFSFTIVQWQNLVIKEIARVTKPAGWFEIDEHAFQPNKMGNITKKTVETAMTAIRNQGLEPEIVPAIGNWIKGSGLFTDIQSSHKEFPIGSWGGSLGEEALKDLDIGLDGLKGLLLPALKITKEQFQPFKKDLLQEMNENQSEYSIWRLWAQKIPNSCQHQSLIST
ncbi:hypothetical protein G9A89_010612 [Geosiphon pyriformis]|nr:hypothetical protein G9A89_010612 [Geosiphon pyriformis]